MKFLDQAKIFITSGKGGDGCTSFRREKYIEFGGPDGGNGGKGSNIIFQTSNNLNTLIDFRYQQHFKGKSGRPGQSKNRTGADAKDIFISVPPGTQILNEDKSVILVDMTKENQKFTIIEGGKGGLGNSHFKSSTNRAPKKHTKGEDSSEMWVWLSLKLFADIGLIGLPNAGKSTLLSKISSANPKIANYPFTTLNPVLGVVKQDYKDFIVADIPGLIEGAHKGKGLGHKFLAHIERCKIILHLIDINNKEIIKNYKVVRSELEKYNLNLSNKKEIIALSKLDLYEEEIKKIKKDLFDYTGKDPIFISSINNFGIQELINKIKYELESFSDETI